MNLRTMLKRFSVEELQQAIRMSRTEGKRAKLEAEAASLRKQLAKVERRLAALDGASGNGAATTPSRPRRKPGRRKGYKLSAATRAKMRAAALRRYGKGKKAEEPATGKRKRKPFSAETRAKMRASQQARWAKVKGTAEPKAQ